ncbi:MAG: DUF418 domain-containing protein [Arenimonas sp.]
MTIASQLSGTKLDRIAVLDVVRGFALLGIFLMNIEYFNRPFQEFGEGIPVTTMGLDYLVARLTEIFVTGKFWVLFSMLFGMGFVVMQTRLGLDGRPFHSIYLRRTIALLIFGLLHIAFLWSGDILHSYALVALVLMWLPIRSVGVSAFLGASLYLAPAFLLLLSGTMMGFLSEAELAKMAAEPESMAQSSIDIANIYAHGDYLAVTQQRWQDFMHVLNYEPFVFLSALGIFLIGAAIMRSGVLLDLKANRHLFLKAMLTCGFLAAALIGLANLFYGRSAMEPKGMLEQALMMMGNLPLSLFYLSAIAYAMSYLSGSKILGILAPAGRMALSNYLMQSLIGSMVFYGYGLGLWMHWGRANLALFVLLVFILQVVFSHIWLRNFRFGPMEWLWRALTYWTLPPMRSRSDGSRDTALSIQP